MITAAQNELLTRVGRGTGMGKFMRQFWIPACLSSELVADGPQMRLMLLGEKLIAFRDTGGRVGSAGAVPSEPASSTAVNTPPTISAPITPR